jgi:hypothetical protein
MRIVILLLLLVALGACVSTDAVRSDPLVSKFDRESEERPARFMGGLQDSFYEHLGGSLHGLDFLWRSIARNSARDWERMKLSIE